VLRKKVLVSPGRRRPLVAVFLLAWALPGAAGSTTSAPPPLIAKAGPGFDITLRTPAGVDVGRIAAGTYTIFVTDRTGDDSHNFHLKGFGVDRATGVPFVGRQRWTVRFTRGKVYRFVCDPHAFVMRGSFRAV
jgi:hypothetical protein